MKAGEAPDMAAKREAYTKHAIDQGVFGAPFFVIDGEIFWGQDRLDFVDRKLAALDHAPRSRSSAAASTAKPLLTMCATSDGSSESVRRRSQPNNRPSGSTSTTCAGSTVGGGESERAHDPGRHACPSGRPPSRRAGRGTPAPRPAAPAPPAAAGSARTAPACGTTSITCFMPCGSMPSWLTATDRASVPTRAEHERIPVRRPQARAPARPRRPSGATATTTASRPMTKKAPRIVSISRSGRNQTTAKPDQRQDGQEDQQRPARIGPISRSGSMG